MLTTTAPIATVGQKLRVAGMTCQHCEMAVAGELSKLAGVTRIDVDVAAGTVLTESVEPLDLDEVGAAIDAAGCELVRG
jgi:copper chaperone CopZ